MPDFGYKSYFILGVQGTDWDTPVTTTSMKQFIYEFISTTLRGGTTPVVPTRFHGNPSPLRQMNNWITAGGDIVMQLHVDNMFELWAQIMHATASETSSTDFVKQEVFADAVWTDPDSLDTQPTLTDPVSAPGLLIFTFSAVQTGSVKITGTDQNDIAIEETLTFAAETTKTTTKYFKTVADNGIDFTDIPPSAETLLIECDKNTYTHVIALGDDVLDGLTIEMVKTTIPSVHIGAVVNSAMLDLGDTLTLTMNLLAKRAWNRYKVPASGTVPTSSNTPTDISGYARITEEIFPGWGLALYLEGSASAINVGSLSMSLNHNLGYPRRFRNVRTEPKPTRQDLRETSLVVTVDYDTTNPDYDLYVYNNQVVQAKILAYRLPFEGPEYSIQIDMPRCQIKAFPDPEVADFSELVQELSLEPIRSAAASSSDEILVTLVNLEAGEV